MNDDTLAINAMVLPAYSDGTINEFLSGLNDSIIDWENNLYQLDIADKDNEWCMNGEIIPIGQVGAVRLVSSRDPEKVMFALSVPYEDVDNPTSQEDTRKALVALATHLNVTPELVNVLVPLFGTDKFGHSEILQIFRIHNCEIVKEYFHDGQTQPYAVIIRNNLGTVKYQ